MQNNGFPIVIRQVKYYVQPVLATDPENTEYEISAGNEHLFSMRRGFNASHNVSWVLTKVYGDENVNSRLVNDIGEAIDSHILK